MNKLLVIINAGHGGKDPGAVAVDGTLEKDYALEISRVMYNRLIECGFSASELAMTRTADTTMDVNGVAEMVRKSNATVCISNHLNSATVNTARGAEVLVSKNNNQLLAKDIEAGFKAMGSLWRGIKTRKLADGRDYYAMHRLTGSVETLIMEYAFINNAQDFAYFKLNALDMIDVVVKALCKRFNKTYISTEEIQAMRQKEAEEVKMREQEKEKSELSEIPKWKLDIMKKSLEIGLTNSLHNPDDVASKWYVNSVIMNAIEIIRKEMKNK